MSRREELREQDELWKERRMVSGHGAQDGRVRDPDYKALIVFLAGPIKHWWDENWMSPEHIRYDEWRTKVEEACIAAGFLVFKPYTAWKGTWNEEAQAVNNAVIAICDVFLNLTPFAEDGSLIPSEGTEAEEEEAYKLRKVMAHFPPGIPTRDDADIERVIKNLMWLADKKNGR